MTPPDAAGDDEDGGSPAAGDRAADLPDAVGGPEQVPADLTIGDVAEQTGVGAATLRMWEVRHGFPEPQRLPSGHRRYGQSTVDTVRDVQARRGRGVRLDVAIADAIAAAVHESEPASPSVYAEVRRRQPGLAVHRLRKSTLLALSWAIEDETSMHGAGTYLFGAFQRDHRFEAAKPRWEELAKIAAASYAFADFPAAVPGRPALVPLAEDHPMRREWAVVADSEELPVALSAWELPGQDGVRDHDRVFESMWTLDPQAVRDASRVCASVAATAGLPGADEVVSRLGSRPRVVQVDPRAATGLFNRIVAYVDRVDR